MFVNLAARLWADECGAVIATEYLMLGTIVAAGSVTGLTAMRDAMVNEYEEFGQSVRDIRKAHTPASLARKGNSPQAAPLYTTVAADGFSLGNDPRPANHTPNSTATP